MLKIYYSELCLGIKISCLSVRVCVYMLHTLTRYIFNDSIKEFSVSTTGSQITYGRRYFTLLSFPSPLPSFPSPLPSIPSPLPSFSSSTPLKSPVHVVNALLHNGSSNPYLSWYDLIQVIYICYIHPHLISPFQPKFSAFSP